MSRNLATSFVSRGRATLCAVTAWVVGRCVRWPIVLIRDLPVVCSFAPRHSHRKDTSCIALLVLHFLLLHFLYRTSCIAAGSTFATKNRSQNRIIFLRIIYILSEVIIGFFPSNWPVRPLIYILYLPFYLYKALGRRPDRG